MRLLTGLSLLLSLAVLVQPIPDPEMKIILHLHENENKAAGAEYGMDWWPEGGGCCPKTSRPWWGWPTTSRPKWRWPTTSRPKWGWPTTSRPQWGWPTTSSPQRWGPTLCTCKYGKASCGWDDSCEVDCNSDCRDLQQGISAGSCNSKEACVDTSITPLDG